METKQITAGYREQQWLQIISQRNKSGLTIKEYCRENGISHHAFYYWQRKLRKIAGNQMEKSCSQEKTPVGWLKINPLENIEDEINVEINGCKIKATPKNKEISIEKLLKIIEEKDRKINEPEQKLQWFMEQFKLSQKKTFGSSGEQKYLNQISLFNEAEDNFAKEIPEPEITQVKSHYRKRTRLTTDKLPEDLPVEEIEHKLPEEECVCPDCGNKMHSAGIQVREELKIIPAKAVLVKHKQHVYSCRACEMDSEKVPMLKAYMPSPVIKGGIACPETIAHIATQKYMMASPLYRQEQEWKQNGILISRQTMSNWLIKACDDWLVPLYDAMKKKLLENEILHVDETTVQVLQEPGKKAQTKSYMWLYRTSGQSREQIIIYEYQPDRRYIHPETFLKDFSGYIHTDGYSAYHKLPQTITVVGCMAHLRRKFYDAYIVLSKEKQSGSLAQKGLNYCDKLFKIERQLSSLDADERYKKRLEFSKPIFEEMYSWITNLQVLPKSAMGIAINYAITQKKYLERYFLDGRLEISNNRAERSIKVFVIGRKNWLFSCTPNGAKASSIYYSLIMTAVENNLNPYEYLSWIFTHAPNLGKSGYVQSFEEFLPGSQSIPSSVYAPKSRKEKNKILPWDEK